MVDIKQEWEDRSVASRQLLRNLRRSDSAQASVLHVHSCPNSNRGMHSPIVVRDGKSSGDLSYSMTWQNFLHHPIVVTF